jgi:hypothetical protein
MEGIQNQPVVVAAQRSRLVAAARAFPVVVGVAIALLGRRLGGGELRRWVMLGTGVAFAGEIVIFAGRYGLSKAFRPRPVPVKQIQSSQTEEVGQAEGLSQAEEFSAALIRRKGGQYCTVFETFVGVSSMDVEIYKTWHGIDMAREIHKADSLKVEEEIGADGIDANEKIKGLNEQRRRLLKELSLLVRAPDHWDRLDVQDKFQELLDVANTLSKEVERFIQAKFPGDLSAQGLYFGEQRPPGYLNCIQAVGSLYWMAANRSYFSAEAADRLSQRAPGTVADDFWNEQGAWVVGVSEGSRGLSVGSRQAEWCQLHNEWYDRNIELARNICKKVDQLDTRFLDGMKRHEVNE